MSDWIGARRILLLSLWGSFLYYPARKKLLQQCLIAHIYSRTRKSTRSSHDESLAATKDEQYFSRLGLPPKLHRLAITYHIISSVVLILLFLELNLTRVADTTNRLFITHYLRCYGPKLLADQRIVGDFMPVLTLVIAINNLSWRFLILFVEDEFELNLIPFLLANDETLKERIRLAGGHVDQDSLRLDILDRSLFYRIENAHANRTNFRLRLNRNLRAKQLLVNKIITFFDRILVTVGLITLVALPGSIHTCFFAQQAAYPDCTIQVGLVGYLVRAAGLGLASLIIFFDQIIVVFVMGFVAYILAYDQINYWQGVRARIEQLYGRMIRARNSRTETGAAGVDAFAANLHEPIRDHANLLPSSDQRELMRHRRHTASEMATAFILDLDGEIVEVQSLLADFLAQLSCVDKFVSIVVPVLLGNWLTCNFAVTISRLQFDFSLDLASMFIRSFQVAAIYVAVGLSAAVLSLKRTVEPIYPVLCNMVAMDKRINKSLWLRLLDSFTRKPRYAFTIWHGSIFTQTTFIRIISYTLTVVIILESSRIITFT